jgi:cytochrome b involved in lipid metabolism
MMRKLVFLSTALFWLIVLVLALTTGNNGEPESTDKPAVNTSTLVTMSEVARHASGEDCWMVIDGRVYDLTAYLPEHPSKPSIVLPWCGKEASQAYKTKTKGRSHSEQADQALANYAIGRVE